MVTVEVTKAEAQAVLAALDWCDSAFDLGERQKAFQRKLLAAFPSLCDHMEYTMVTELGEKGTYRNKYCVGCGSALAQYLVVDRSHTGAGAAQAA